MIAQVAPGAVWISSVASVNGATGDESETTATGRKSAAASGRGCLS